jgi:predicted esterase
MSFFGMPAASERTSTPPQSLRNSPEPRRHRGFPGWRAGAVLLALAAALLAPSRAAVPVDGNGFFHLQSAEGPYVGYAPDTYNPGVPINLFVWMHGCGGDSEGDMWAIAPVATRANQSYIAISIGGRDGACWDPTADRAKVLAAIRDVARYFTINPRKIYIGGYSSGGDLAYRTAFENAYLFAGVLAENTDPFRDTGRSTAELIAAASWKFRIAHLAHTEDDTYPIAQVRADLATAASAGFPVVKIEKPGHHYDDDAGATGTNYDLRTFLLPYLDAGWASPPPPPPALKVTTHKKVVTKSARYTVKGTIPAGALVVSVQVKLKKKVQTAAVVDGRWSLKLRLKPGLNRVTVQALGADGATSRPVKLLIVRR